MLIQLDTYIGRLLLCLYSTSVKLEESSCSKTICAMCGVWNKRNQIGWGVLVEI